MMNDDDDMTECRTTGLPDNSCARFNTPSEYCAAQLLLHTAAAAAPANWQSDIVSGHHTCDTKLGMMIMNGAATV